MMRQARLAQACRDTGPGDTAADNQALCRFMGCVWAGYTLFLGDKHIAFAAKAGPFFQGKACIGEAIAHRARHGKGRKMRAGDAKASNL